MRTDKLFYELCRGSSQVLSALLQRKTPCDYTGWSISLKERERQIDLIFIPEEKGKEVYIVEFQGYYEKYFYLYHCRRTFQTLEDYDLIDYPWKLISVFLSREFDPNWDKWKKKLHLKDSFPLERIYLEDLPQEYWDQSPTPWALLQVLFLKSKEDLKETFSKLEKRVRAQKVLIAEKEEQVDLLIQIVENQIPQT